MATIRKNFQVGSEDKNDCVFVGQRIQWKTDEKRGPYINVHQNVAIDECVQKCIRPNRLATVENPISYRLSVFSDDKSSQRAHVVFLAEERDLHKGLLLITRPINYSYNYVNHRCRTSLFDALLWYMLIYSWTLVRHFRRTCRCSHSH